MLRFEEFEQVGGVIAGISGLEDGDCAHASPEIHAQARLLKACGLDVARLSTIRQMHGSTIVEAVHGARPEADGLWTHSENTVLGVSVADCVPVYLSAPEHGVIQLLHAGREGTCANIAGAAITLLKNQLNIPAGNWVAQIGPSAGPCCYEVSADMAREFAGAGHVVHGRYLDLWETNRQQLLASGLESDRIFVSRHCTICGTGFHSYRASGSSRRNLAFMNRK